MSDPPRRLTPGARRILDVASELFYRRGIHAVGVDVIAAESGVTKRTLYDRFGSKDGLVEAYLEERDLRWRAAVESRRDAASGPAGRVLAPFDVLPDWIAGNPRGCAFVNAFPEFPDAAHAVRGLIRSEKRWLLDHFRTELAAAGADEVDAPATELTVLHEGALAATGAGEMPDAAVAAARAARGVVDRALPA